MGGVPRRPARTGRVGGGGRGDVVVGPEASVRGSKRIACADLGRLGAAFGREWRRPWQATNSSIAGVGYSENLGHAQYAGVTFVLTTTPLPTIFLPTLLLVTKNGAEEGGSELGRG